MALHRWPTDPKGKAPAHTISWSAHQAHLKANANPAKKGEVKVSTPNGFIPVSEWDFNGGGGTAGVETAPEPVAPGLLPLPVDAAYDDEIAGHQKTRDDTITGLGGARTRGLLDYGFTEDPATKALAFDPNNPFSRAALLKKNFDVSRNATGQQMGAGGQLYAGSFQTAQDSINRNQLGSEDTLQKSLTGFLANNSNAVTNTGNQYEFNAARAAAARTGRAADNPLYSPTASTAALAPKPTPKPVVAKPVVAKKLPALMGKTLTAAPNRKGVTKTKKGNTVTYTASVKGP